MGSGKAAGAFVAVLVAAFAIMNALPAEGLAWACVQEAALAAVALAGTRFACPGALAFTDGKRCTESVQHTGSLRRVGAVVSLVGLLAGAYTLATWGFCDVDFAGELAAAQAPAGFEAVRRAALSLAVCVTTAVFEESFARVLCIEALEGALRPTASRTDEGRPCGSRAQRPTNRAAGASSPTNRAVLLSSLFFALLHVGVPAADASDAVLLQSVLKFMQALLFGLVMGTLYAGTRRLLPCVAIHACFDVLYLGPFTLLTGALPETYASGFPFDTVLLAVTTILLAGIFKWEGTVPLPHFRDGV